MVLLVLKGKKSTKVFGAPGTWYCPVKQCKMVATTDEIDILDKTKEISWAKLSDSPAAVSITPLCPFHGVPLDFHSSIDLVTVFNNANKINPQFPLALPASKASLTGGAHPHSSASPLHL